MRFFDPTNVYLEHNCVENHSKELAALGQKAFLITGKHSAKANGSLKDVTAALESQGIPYAIFDQIEENPSVETVAKAAAIGMEEGADFVIGIGGGSPLDAAKAIALLMANPQETADCLYISKDLKPLPVAAVPTTCGTGSEVTPNAVLTRHALKTKKSISYHIYPDLALVDGKYLETASRTLLIHTAVDALAHCVESRLHVKANEYNHMFSEYGLKLWGNLVPFFRGEKEADAQVYETLMLTSTVAGMAIAQTGTSLPHALSYWITYRHGVAHGKACGLFLPSYMKEYAKHNKEDVACVLSLLGFDSLDAFAAFLTELLGTESMDAEEIELCAEDMMQNPGKLSTWPYDISKEDVLHILEGALN